MHYCYDYPRPAVTTDAILINRSERGIFILLIQRGVEPYKNYWALPGGFVNMDEELELACTRELQEETGISGIKLTQLATFGAVHRDPRGRTISIVFWGETEKMLPPVAGDDASKAAWYLLDELPPLAFDHEIIISYFKETAAVIFQK
jgi:8-oxo-dGTP diphosphatase